MHEKVSPPEISFDPLFVKKQQECFYKKRLPGKATSGNKKYGKEKGRIILLFKWEHSSFLVFKKNNFFFKTV